jgi:polysaccharide export outer membrane protein
MTVVNRFFVVCMLLLAGCATAPGSGEAPKFNADVQAVDTYHIGVDDQLQVSVWHNPDLSVSVPVP